MAHKAPPPLEVWHLVLKLNHAALRGDTAYVSKVEGMLAQRRRQSMVAMTLAGAEDAATVAVAANGGVSGLARRGVMVSKLHRNGIGSKRLFLRLEAFGADGRFSPKEGVPTHTRADTFGAIVLWPEAKAKQVGAEPSTAGRAIERPAPESKYFWAVRDLQSVRVSTANPRSVTVVGARTKETRAFKDASKVATTLVFASTRNAALWAAEICAAMADAFFASDEEEETIEMSRRPPVVISRRPPAHASAQGKGKVDFAAATMRPAATAMYADDELNATLVQLKIELYAACLPQLLHCMVQVGEGGESRDWWKVDFIEERFFKEAIDDVCIDNYSRAKSGDTEVAIRALWSTIARAAGLKPRSKRIELQAVVAGLSVICSASDHETVTDIIWTVFPTGGDDDDQLSVEQISKYLHIILAMKVRIAR